MHISLHYFAVTMHCISCLKQSRAWFLYFVLSSNPVMLTLRIGTLLKNARNLFKNSTRYFNLDDIIIVNIFSYLILLIGCLPDECVFPLFVQYLYQILQERLKWKKKINICSQKSEKLHFITNGHCRWTSDCFIHCKSLAYKEQYGVISY